MKCSSKKLHRRRPLRRRGAARVIAEAPSPSIDHDVVERPDGYYWLGPGREEVFGPFESPLAARAERDRWNEEAPAEGETLREAQSEVGIADWIDAESGEPAQGQSPPHFEEP